MLFSFKDFQNVRFQQILDAVDANKIYLEFKILDFFTKFQLYDKRYSPPIGSFAD